MRWPFLGMDIVYIFIVFFLVFVISFPLFCLKDT